MIKFVENKIKSYYFVKKWKKINKHNSTIPTRIFPIKFVKIGSYTYGEIYVWIYDEFNQNDKLEIGNYVSIAENVKFLLSENHQTNTFTNFPLKSILNNKHFCEDSLSKGSIIIEDEVWLGYGVTILSGVKIGKGAIIAAGSVVTKDIPPYTVAGGIPAKIIKHRFSEEITKSLLKLRLIDLPENIIKQNLDLFYKTLNTKEDLNSIELLFVNFKNEKCNTLL
ncbi:MAG TPA: CatB-related O-acetyltransferase [Candidatus Paceibacterota bacterium]